MKLTEEQKRAVGMVAFESHRLCLLTGGPGTGKTITVRAIAEALKQTHTRVRLCAPSGKAAKRLEEATGRPATTIHRMLRIYPGAQRPEPVMAEVVIVDEASMVDVELLSMLYRACGDGAVQTVLLVGDPDQLPPVGSGQPFRDYIEAGNITTLKLTQVHRQAEGSGIIAGAYAVQAGRSPEWGDDLRLVTVEDAAEIPARVFGLASELGLDPNSSQVLAPQRTGPCGCNELNSVIESRRQGEGQGDDLMRGKFRAGTKVIHIKNDKDMGVFNGELGWVVSVESHKDARHDQARVEIAGDVKSYGGRQLSMLEPAWALTVHKSQGSEWDTVIVIAHPSQAYMLSRSLLYVALTRGKRRVIVVGTQEAVNKAVRKVLDLRRQTWLGPRLERARAADRKRMLAEAETSEAELSALPGAPF